MLSALCCTLMFHHLFKNNQQSFSIVTFGEQHCVKILNFMILNDDPLNAEKKIFFKHRLTRHSKKIVRWWENLEHFFSSFYDNHEKVIASSDFNLIFLFPHWVHIAKRYRTTRKEKKKIIELTCLDS